jgi:hypothetical protein
MITQTNVKGYIGYFRNLAISHKDIRHDPNAETGNGEPLACRFARYGVEEIVKGLSHTIGFPALMLELYEWQTESEQAYDIKGSYSGAFSIVKNAEKGKTDDEIECLSICEKIAFDILKKIWQDHYGKDANRCTAAFEFFDMNGIEMQPMSGVFDNCFGWRVAFKFNFRQTQNITSAIESGTFL